MVILTKLIDNMKKYFFAFLFMFTLISYAGERDSVQVGPGVWYFEEYDPAGPWQFDVLRIDLTNPFISLKTVKANDRLRANERTSSMAGRNDHEGHRVVGAVNGDFYDGSGLPLGAQVSNGEILKTDFDWFTIGFSKSNQPLIADVSFSGTVISDSGNGTLNSVNYDRAENFLVLYNSYFGSSTATNAWGTEVIINPIESWSANDTTTVVVEQKQTAVGNITIPAGKAVLSGHGTGEQFLSKVNIGDTLHLVMNFSPAPKYLDELIGGNVKLIVDGNIVVGTGDRHPRTAAGFNSDSTMLYLITVDGRQAGYSVGMSYVELATYMKSWGVYQALNLDGGGSTTMLVRGEIKNSPSDIGGERAVANSLLVVSSAPTGPLAHLRISPREVFVAAGADLNFDVQRFDEYYNPLPLNTAPVSWSCDPAIGLIGEDGEFVAASDTASGYVTVSTGAIDDSVFVTVTRLTSIILSPDPVILKTGEIQQMTAEAFDNLGNPVQLQPDTFEWLCSTEIGEISNTGLFHALQAGEGTITAKYDGVIGEVNAVVGFSASAIVEDFSDLNGMNLTGTLVNLAQCSLTLDNTIFISPSSSAKMNYSLTTGGTSALYLNCTIPISGTPDKIGLFVYGDGKGHWLRGEFNDKDNEKFLINFTAASPGIDWIDQWKFLQVGLSEAVPSWSNPNAVLDFPITWKKIYLAETNDSKKDDGVLYFDDMTVDFITSAGKDDAEIPEQSYLLPNYPNPFNPETTISFVMGETGRCILDLYSVTGEKILRLTEDIFAAGTHNIKFDGSNLPSGFYILRMENQENIRTGKLMLIK